jgi:hypothetical protein
MREGAKSVKFKIKIIKFDPADPRPYGIRSTMNEYKRSEGKLRISHRDPGHKDFYWLKSDGLISWAMEVINRREGEKMKLKALSIKEPWASLILSGKKTIETRTWTTRYRGSLLICASKKPDSPIAGMAVAVADVVDSRPMTRKDERKACCKVYDDAKSWVLENVRPIKPFPVSGKLGLFDVEHRISFVKASSKGKAK